ncbi:MAG: class II aldolase/adducin family protein [Oscillospiraceae bacterium]|nr:class II aldolase/adducin family protein [Oscillospiraceae bacterium]
MFFEEHAKLLSDFSRISKAAGARADYVQGGGGNTSVKLPGGLMAIKASGFCLSDIAPDRAYAVLDCVDLKDFYLGSEPSDFENVEQTGSARAKADVRHIDGLADLRPSVEAGFHSILSTFVLHTHSVYANLAACSTACRDIAEQAFEGANYTWGWVPYTDPGANLTFAIRDELRRVEEKTGKIPSVILMQNHGIIVHDDNPNRCLAIHTDANARLAGLFGLTATAFPEVTVQEMAGGFYAAGTPYLAKVLRDGGYTQEFLMTQPLYPDQMVFLTDSFSMDRRGIPEGQTVASTKTGQMLLNMEEKKALTLTQTLTAVFFVMEHIKAAGYEVSTMGEAAKHFISSWESEKYRKSLSGKQA